MKYEFASARALRGTEARTITKWQKDGWELDTQTQGTLRTEMTFRRVKPKNAWQRSVAFVAAHWPAFGRLKSTTQQLLLAAVGAVVALSLTAGAVVAGAVGRDASTSTASPSGRVPAPSGQSTENPDVATASPSAQNEAAPYVYQGRPYEVIVIDENVGAAGLTRYWVLTSPFDYSTDEYKNEIKMIITDIAQRNGTAELMVDVVTDREVAEGEAFSTFRAFEEEHGPAYVVGPLLEKERVHWAASYTGGYDYNTSEASESADAFEVLWRPYAAEEREMWKPTLAE